MASVRRGRWRGRERRSRRGRLVKIGFKMVSGWVEGILKLMGYGVRMISRLAVVIILVNSQTSI